MCNLSEGVVEKAIIIKAVEVIDALIESGATLDFALKIANIDQQTYDEYKNSTLSM